MTRSINLNLLLLGLAAATVLLLSPRWPIDGRFAFLTVLVFVVLHVVLWVSSAIQRAEQRKPVDDVGPN